MRTAGTLMVLGRLMLATLVGLTAGCGAPTIAKLVAQGDQRTLRARAAGAPTSSPSKPPILYLAFDGVNRDLLYDMLRKGKLPNLSTLLGGAGGQFPHAPFDERLLSTLPSSTMAAWVTTMTGVAHRAQRLAP